MKETQDIPLGSPRFVMFDVVSAKPEHTPSDKNKYKILKFVFEKTDKNESHEIEISGCFAKDLF